MGIEIEKNIFYRINKSKCGTCNKCENTCPAKAIKGILWSANVQREKLIDPFKFIQKARKLLKERIGIEMTICGKCIDVCPVTQGYIRKSEVE